MFLLLEDSVQSNFILLLIIIFNLPHHMGTSLLNDSLTKARMISNVSHFAIFFSEMCQKCEKRAHSLFDKSFHIM